VLSHPVKPTCPGKCARWPMLRVRSVDSMTKTCLATGFLKGKNSQGKGNTGRQSSCGSCTEFQSSRIQRKLSSHPSARHPVPKCWKEKKGFHRSKRLRKKTTALRSRALTSWVNLDLKEIRKDNLCGDLISRKRGLHAESNGRQHGQVPSQKGNLRKSSGGERGRAKKGL